MAGYIEQCIVVYFVYYIYKPIFDVYKQTDTFLYIQYNVLAL